jgi:hypothetical protein
MTSASSTGEREVLRAVFSWVNVLGTAVIGIGGLGAVWDWEPGAYIMIAGLALTVLAHLVVGALAYLDVMSRPWPRVRSLTDDDW